MLGAALWSGMCCVCPVLQLRASRTPCWSSEHPGVLGCATPCSDPIPTLALLVAGAKLVATHPVPCQPPELHRACLGMATLAPAQAQLLVAGWTVALRDVTAWGRSQDTAEASFCSLKLHRTQAGRCVHPEPRLQGGA